MRKPSAARRATAPPMRPSPTMPSVLPCTSTPKHASPMLCGPVAGFHPLRQFDDAPRACEDQREHRIRGGLGQHVRRVREHDAAAREIGDVEVVEADRHRRENLQAGCAFEHVGRDFYACADRGHRRFLVRPRRRRGRAGRRSGPRRVRSGTPARRRAAACRRRFSFFLRMGSFRFARWIGRWWVGGWGWGWGWGLLFTPFDALGLLWNLFSFWFICSAPVRGGTHFLCCCKESKQRKQLPNANPCHAPPDRSLGVVQPGECR